MAAGRRYYLDTNVVISVVEATNAFGAAQLRFIERIDAGEIEAVTSELTLAECLVKPFAERDVVAIAAYLRFLAGRKELPVLPVSRGVLLDAARLRSELPVKLPDAIHIATPISAACHSFLTSDRGIRLPGGIASIWWDELQ